MDVRRYEIFLRVKRNFVCPSGHVMFYLLYKPMEYKTISVKFFFSCERRDLLCSHSNGDLFTCEDIMFLRQSSPGISLVIGVIERSSAREVSSPSAS